MYQIGQTVPVDVGESDNMLIFGTGTTYSSAYGGTP